MAPGWSRWRQGTQLDPEHMDKAMQLLYDLRAHHDREDKKRAARREKKKAKNRP